LIHTRDGGFHWTQESTNTTHPLNRVFFFGRERGWTVGFGGTILAYSTQAQDNSPKLKRAPVLKVSGRHH
jgi:photosystem II stability/assembly factor-like uncharacterized protein